MRFLKLFEQFGSDLKEEIEDHVENIFDIDDFFDKNYMVDTGDYYEYIGNDTFWYFVDDEEFIKDWIKNEIDYYYEDWEHRFDSKYERDGVLIPYIVDNIDDDDGVREKVIELYIVNYLGLDPEDEDDKKEIEQNDLELYNWDKYLGELDIEFSREIIDTYFDRSTFIENVLEKQYEKSSARDILDEFGYVGDTPKESLDNYTNLSWYIDENKVAKYIKDNEGWDYKKEYFLDNFLNNDIKENSLIKIYEEKPELSYLLFEEIEDKMYFTKDYKFQKICLDYWIDDLVEEDEIVDKLIEMSEKFGINSKLEKKEKYKDYFILLNASRFGL